MSSISTVPIMRWDNAGGAARFDHQPIINLALETSWRGGCGRRWKGLSPAARG